MSAFSRELHNDSAYQSLPSQIDEELLTRRVEALRGGDLSLVRPIAESLMRPVLAVVNQNTRHIRDTEPIGVALLELVEAVTRAAYTLTDNDILKFVLFSVIKRLQDEDNGFGPKSRTRRMQRSKGIECEIHRDYEHVATAKREVPTLEFRETLESIVRSDRDKLILEMRAERYTLQEIAEKAKVDDTIISKNLKALEARFEKANS